MSFFAPDPPVVYRPLSLSILGWYLSLGALGAFFPLLMLYSNSPALGIWAEMGLDPQVLAGLSIVTGIVQGTVGVAILKRVPWGRTLYLVFTPLQIVATALFLGTVTFSGLAAGALIYGFVFFLLTRQAAQDYFDGTVLEEPTAVAALRSYRREQGNRSDLARIFAIIVAFGSTFMLIMVPMMIAGVSLATGERAFPVSSEALSVGGVLVGITVGSLLLGTLLWGFRRWKAYLGWIILVAGVSLFMTSLSMPTMLDAAFWERMPNMRPEYSEKMVEVIKRAIVWMKIGGLAYLSVGGALVWFQRMADLAALEEE